MIKNNCSPRPSLSFIAVYVVFFAVLFAVTVSVHSRDPNWNIYLIVSNSILSTPNSTDSQSQEMHRLQLIFSCVFIWLLFTCNFILFFFID